MFKYWTPTSFRGKVWSKAMSVVLFIRVFSWVTIMSVIYASSSKAAKEKDFSLGLGIDSLFRMAKSWIYYYLGSVSSLTGGNLISLLCISAGFNKPAIPPFNAWLILFFYKTYSKVSLYLYLLHENFTNSS